MSVLDCAQ